MAKNIAERTAELSPVSIAKLEQELGFANGTIRKWAKSSPTADKLIKVADYLGVSVDRLLGHEVQEKRSPLVERPDLSVGFVKEYKELLSNQHFLNLSKLFKAIDDAKRAIVFGYVVGLLQQQGINVQSILG